MKPGWATSWQAEAHPSARQLDTSAAAAAVLGCHFAAVFVSVAAQNVAAALGWLVFLASLVHGGPAERRRVLRSGPMPVVVLFVVASAVSALANGAVGVGWRTIRPEILAMGCLAAGLSIRRAEHARACAWVLVVVAAIVGIWSLYQVTVVFGGETNPGRRATGFWHLGASVSYGNVLAIVFALALCLAVWGRGRVRAVAAAAALMMSTGMILSYIRASWLASSLVVAIVGVWRRSIALLLALAIAVAAVAVVPAAKVVADRVLITLDPTFEGNADRLARYRVATRVIRDYPVFGTGAGRLREVYPMYAVPGALVNSHLHNTYVQLVAERGLLAMAAWLVALVGGVAHALRASVRLDGSRRGLAMGVGMALSVALFLCLFNYTWEDWRIRSIMLGLLGLAWSPGATLIAAGEGIASVRRIREGST